MRNKYDYIYLKTLTISTLFFSAYRIVFLVPSALPLYAAITLADLSTIYEKRIVDDTHVYPELIHKAVEGLKNLNDSDIIMILGYIDRLQK